MKGKSIMKFDMFLNNTYSYGQEQQTSTSNCSGSNSYAKMNMVK